MYKHSQTGAYVAQISFENTTYSLGCFDAPEKASEVYEAKRAELHKEFRRKSAPNVHLKEAA